MTTGALLLSLSSLASGSALEHLQHIVGGSGQITWIPAQTITADIELVGLSADITNDIKADISITNVDANVIQKQFTADIISSKIEGNV